MSPLVHGKGSRGPGRVVPDTVQGATEESSCYHRSMTSNVLEKGPTREEVGARLGVRGTTVSRYLVGDRYPSPATALRIEKSYGVPVGEVIRRSEAARHDTEAREEWLTWLSKLLSA